MPPQRVFVTRFPFRLALVASATLLASCAHNAPSTTPAPAAEREATTTRDGSHDSSAPQSAATSTATASDSTKVSSEDVKQTALQVFGDSVAPAGAEAPDSGAAEPTWDLDVRPYETQDRVAYYVRMFSGDARDRFEARLERGSRYEPMMRAKLHAAGLPEDFVYLALIESGYDPDAYSRAAAVGMWQLMTGTARGVGLRVDWWVDERRDPVRSTDAAIRFLRYLNDQFGSLYLAAAAYNGGPGRVSRGLTKYADDLEGTTGEDRFFALAETDYLRAETRNYVPQLIAAALVAKEPARYGLTLRTVAPYAYDTVTVPASTPLAAIARASGTALSALVDLNPHILRGATPPKTRFTVRVPVGNAVGFDSAFAALPVAERTAYARLISKKGETVPALARRAKVTTRQLGWYNPKLEVARKSGRVVAGQTVLVPTAAVVAAARDVPDPAVEIYGSSSRGAYHTVKRGETLGGIAKRYRTSTAALMRMNGLRKSIIIPGQRLVVKGGTARRPGKARAGSSVRAKNVPKRSSTTPSRNAERGPGSQR
jgi:membrane-bound lytic murein transglycosylase D